MDGWLGVINGWVGIREIGLCMGRWINGRCGKMDGWELEGCAFMRLGE